MLLNLVVCEYLPLGRKYVTCPTMNLMACGVSELCQHWQV